MNSGVYKITNSVTGKVYIGSTVDFASRWRKHRRELARGDHANEILQRAWVKYGADTFVFEKLLVCERKDTLLYEQRAMDVLHPEYNICRNAGNVLGIKRRPFSSTHRLRLSEARKRRPPEKRTPEQCKRMSEGQRGRVRGPMSDANKEAIANALRGRKKSPEHIEKVRVANLGKNKGRKPSPETRAKLSAAAKTAWNRRKELA